MAKSLYQDERKRKKEREREWRPGTFIIIENRVRLLERAVKADFRANYDFNAHKQHREKKNRFSEEDFNQYTNNSGHCLIFIFDFPARMCVLVCVYRTRWTNAECSIELSSNLIWFWFDLIAEWKKLITEVQRSLVCSLPFTLPPLFKQDNIRASNQNNCYYLLSSCRFHDINTLFWNLFRIVFARVHLCISGEIRSHINAIYISVYISNHILLWNGNVWMHMGPSQSLCLSHEWIIHILWNCVSISIYTAILKSCHENSLRNYRASQIARDWKFDLNLIVQLSSQFYFYSILF